MNFTLGRKRGDRSIAPFVFVGLCAMSASAPGPVPSVRAAEMFTVRLTVGKGGFEPNRVAVPVGAVRIVVTSREGDHCFAIPSLDVEKRVRAGRPLETDVTFDRTGEVPFLCCVDGAASGETGVLVVTPGK